MGKLIPNAGLVAVAGIAVALAGSPAAAAPVSIRSHAAQEMRFSTIAYRMGTASADLCRERQMMTGLILHDLTHYDPAVRPAVSRAFSLNSGIGVVEVVPGSAAQRSGLQVDDEILRVGSHSVETAEAFHIKGKARKRTDRFAELLRRTLAAGKAQLLIRRRGQLHQVELEGQPGCGGNLLLSNSAKMNAWSDGSSVVVTTGMANLARSDDEIAFVIAHEMAHNMLGHSQESNNRHSIFGSIAGSRRSELNADSFAVMLMDRAGYRPGAGISFLQKVGKQLWWSLSLTHPGFGQRMRTVEVAMNRLNQAESPKPTHPQHGPLQVR